MQRLRPWLHDVVHRLGDGESSELQYKFDKAGRNRLELTGGVLEVAHDNCWRHADNYDLDKENISLILGPGCCGPAYNLACKVSHTCTSVGDLPITNSTK